MRNNPIRRFDPDTVKVKDIIRSADGSIVFTLAGVDFYNQKPAEQQFWTDKRKEGLFTWDPYDGCEKQLKGTCQFALRHRTKGGMIKYIKRQLFC